MSSRLIIAHGRYRTFQAQVEHSHLELTPDHAKIEDEEDARERKFEGLPETADLTQDHVVQDPLDDHAHAPGEGPDGQGSPQTPFKAGDEVPPPPRLHREDPGATPQRLQKTVGAAKDDWAKAGQEAKGKEYEHDHARPRSAEERLRAGVPYSEFIMSREVDREEYKFRKGLRADEF